jgi:tetratricopeptide (TPR) repeat protein
MKIRNLLCVVLLILSAHAFAGDRDAALVMVSSAEKKFNEGQYDVAQSMCERALAEDKDCPEAHLLLGRCYQELGKTKEAMASYQLAFDLANKSNNNAVKTKATDAAKKLAPGLLDIWAADQKLVDKMMTLASNALNDQQLETARSAYQAVVALAPSNEEAKKNLADVEQRILARGDPVKARISAAALAESFYYMGIGQKDKAKEMADSARKYSDTSAGKEAAHLIDCNFDISKTIKDDLAQAKTQLKQVQSKPAPVKVSTTPSPSTPTPSAAPATGVDVDAVEKTAAEDAKKAPKDKLVPTFSETYAKGREFYSKAAPGTEGNQKNVAAALEQFIRCEAFYLRIEQEKLMTPEVEDNEKQASMLRYACMKMTILSH